MLSQRKIIFIFSCVLALTFFIYAKGLNGPFMLDDFHNIRPLIKSELNIADLKDAIALNGSGIHPMTRALPTVSFVATNVLHGPHSYGFKLHNLIIHLICGVLIFLFTLRLVRTYKPENNSNATLVAFFASSIWLLHPLQVSSVLYIVQRIAQLSTLFTMGALVCYLYGRTTCNPRLKFSLYFVLYPICLILGLMSKENAALIFIFVALTEIFIRNFTRTNKVDSTFLFTLCYIPILLGILLFLKMSPSLLDYSLRQFTLEERLLSQAYFVAFYLKQILLPELSRMGLYFDDIAVFKTLSPLIGSLIAMHFSFLIGGIWLSYKGKIIGYAIAFFYAGHLLESTVIPLEIAFEHRNYLPLIGISIGLATIVSYITSNSLKGCVIVLILSILATLLFTRVGFWKDEHEWQKTKLAFHPNSLRTRVSYLEYLDFNKKSAMLKQASIDAERDFPKEPIFIMSRLSRECILIKNTTLGDKSLDETILLLKSEGINGSRLSNISSIVENHTRNSCTNLSFGKLFELMDVAITLEEAKNSSAFIGHLKAIKSMLLVKENKFIGAKDLLVEAYEDSGSIRYLFNAVTVMSFKTEHSDIARNLILRIKSTPSAGFPVYAKQIISAEQQLLTREKEG